MSPPDKPDMGSPSVALPETIGSADLETLNRALETLFTKLRRVGAESPDADDDRKRAIRALNAVWWFLLEFRPVQDNQLHVPLLNLAAALAGLDQNQVAPMLRPKKRSGRSVTSFGRAELMGIAVGSAKRLEWIGIGQNEADRRIAEVLAELRVPAARGNGRITARTVRSWRESIEAVRPIAGRPEIMTPNDVAWSNALREVEDMTSAEWKDRILAMTADKASASILTAMRENIVKMKLGRVDGLRQIDSGDSGIRG